MTGGECAGENMDGNNAADGGDAAVGCITVEAPETPDVQATVAAELTRVAQEATLQPMVSNVLSAALTDTPQPEPTAVSVDTPRSHYRPNIYAFTTTPADGNFHTPANCNADGGGLGIPDSAQPGANHHDLRRWFGLCVRPPAEWWRPIPMWWTAAATSRSFWEVSGIRVRCWAGMTGWTWR